MSTISASTTSTTAYKVTADTTGTLVLQTGSSPTTAVTIDGSQNAISTATYQISTNTTPSTASGNAIFYKSASGAVLSGYQVLLETGGAGSRTTAATIDSSGNVGIGVTSPSQRLGIASGSDSTNVGDGIAFWGSSVNKQAAILSYNFGAYDGDLRFYTSKHAAASTSTTEAMRIDPSGNLLIGGSSQLASERLRVEGGAANITLTALRNTHNASGDRNLYCEMGANTNNTSSYFLDCSTSGVGPKFYIYGNGTYGTISDATLKKNIETARDGYISDLCKLRVVKYNWNTDEDGTPKELGWIAQELAEVFPGMVQDSKPLDDGTVLKEVKTSVLPFMLLKAIQELKAELDAAKADIATLKGAA